MTPIASASERLTDWHFELTDLDVDRKDRLVRNIALTGRESRNGYRYADEALQAAVSLYDRKPVFLDHAGDRSRPQDRSTRDLVGTIVAPRFEEGRIRADVRVVDTESGRTFLALVEEEAPGIGMSQVVLARRSADGTVVDHIEEVVSVDAVVNPATTRTFRESAESSEHNSDTPGESLLSPESVTETETLQTTLATLMAERDQLRSQLRSVEQHRERDMRASRRNALLVEASLPGWAVTETFRKVLERADDDATCRELIRERLELISRAARHPPTSNDRPLGEERSSIGNAAFVAAIKQR